MRLSLLLDHACPCQLQTRQTRAPKHRRVHMLWQTRHDGSTRCDALLAVRHAKKWCGGTPRYRRVPRRKSDRARVRVREVKAPLRTALASSNRRLAVPATLGRMRRAYPTV